MIKLGKLGRNTHIHHHVHQHKYQQLAGTTHQQELMLLLQEAGMDNITEEKTTLKNNLIELMIVMIDSNTEAKATMKFDPITKMKAAMNEIKLKVATNPNNTVLKSAMANNNIEHRESVPVRIYLVEEVTTMV